MRKMGIIAVGLLIAALSAYAGDVSREILTLTATSTNKATAVTASSTKIRGEILDIYVDLATATTGTVSVVVDPELSTMANITLLSVTNTADGVYRPRFDVTDAAGAALTSDEPVPFLAIGDTITATGSNFDATSKVVKVVIKYKKQ